MDMEDTVGMEVDEGVPEPDWREELKRGRLLRSGCDRLGDPRTELLYFHGPWRKPPWADPRVPLALQAIDYTIHMTYEEIVKSTWERYDKVIAEVDERVRKGLMKEPGGLLRTVATLDDARYDELLIKQRESNKNPIIPIPIPGVDDAMVPLVPVQEEKLMYLKFDHIRQDGDCVLDVGHGRTKAFSTQPKIVLVKMPLKLVDHLANRTPLEITKTTRQPAPTPLIKPCKIVIKRLPKPNPIKPTVIKKPKPNPIKPNNQTVIKKPNPSKLNPVKTLEKTAQPKPNPSKLNPVKTLEKTAQPKPNPSKLHPVKTLEKTAQPKPNPSKLHPVKTLEKTAQSKPGPQQIPKNVPKKSASKSDSSPVPYKIPKLTNASSVDSGFSGKTSTAKGSILLDKNKNSFSSSFKIPKLAPRPQAPMSSVSHPTIPATFKIPKNVPKKSDSSPVPYKIPKLTNASSVGSGFSGKTSTAKGSILLDKNMNHISKAQLSATNEAGITFHRSDEYDGLRELPPKQPCLLPVVGGDDDDEDIIELLAPEDDFGL